MAALDEIDVEGQTTAPPSLVDDLKKIFSAELWQWFENHKTEVIFEKRMFRFFNVRLTVGDLEQLFVRLFGLKPF